jgi:hypothetical protein
MTPTAKLRFVERTVQVPFQNYKDVTESKTVRILQQWWEVEQNIIDRAAGRTQGEWRDVPLEDEQA